MARHLFASFRSCHPRKAYNAAGDQSRKQRPILAAAVSASQRPAVQNHLRSAARTDTGGFPDVATIVAVGEEGREIPQSREFAASNQIIDTVRAHSGDRWRHQGSPAVHGL